MVLDMQSLFLTGHLIVKMVLMRSVAILISEVQFIYSYKMLMNAMINLPKIMIQKRLKMMEAAYLIMMMRIMKMELYILDLLTIE